MGRFRGAVVASLILACSAAGAASAAGAVRTPVRAAELGAAPASARLLLVLPLAADYSGLERWTVGVTTPGSPRYGQYESIPELARRFGASRTARTRVVGFLRRAGATDVKIDATGLFADATMTAGLAEHVFSAPLARFHTARDGRFIAPRGPVRLPSALRGLASGVIGLDTRPVLAQGGGAGGRVGARGRSAARIAQASSAANHSGTSQGCAAGVGTDGFTPNQYLTAYGYDPLHAGGETGQGERVALIEIDGFKYSDILKFASCFGLDVPAMNAFGVGVSHGLRPGAEATLDLEVLDAAAPDLKSIDVYESNGSLAQALRGLTAPLQNRGFKPQVISASLGQCEAEWYLALGPSGINAAEGAFRMASASGITYLAATGDSGSADCTANGAPTDHLAVNYPASSWWVTAVGGTNLKLTAANQIANQMVWNDAGDQPGSAGGGGSSQLFRRPSYQNSTVGGNRRAIPDASMLSDVAPGYAIYCSAGPPDCDPSNPWTTFGGTSAATPLLAGGFALVDQSLRMNGRQDLGLANSLLYQLGRSSMRGNVFYDVTSIGNDVGPYIPGNGHPLGCCSAGPGYDRATGWGSVDLGQFASLALQHQPRIVNVGVSLPGHQHPIAKHRILATVSCSGACLMAAAARVRLGGSGSFEADSNISRLKAKGARTISIRFSIGQLSKLRSALAAHKPITATVYGVVLDAAGNVERRSGGKVLGIEG